MLKKMLILLLTAGLLLAVPNAVMAAAFKLSATAKTAMDKLAASDKTSGGKITSQYNELLKVQAETSKTESAVTLLHKANSDAEALVRKQITAINAVKRSQLEAQVKQTRDKYEPLFTMYTALNKQISAARALNSKTYSSILRSQADIVQSAVQLARADIKIKESALKAVKDSTSQTAKKIRATLDEADPLRARISAEKSAMSTPKKLITEFGKNLNQAIKQKSASGVLASLNSMVTTARQLGEQNKKILDLEKKVSDVIAKAKGQIPKP